MEPRDLSDHAEYRAGRGVEEVAEALGREPGEFDVLSSNESAIGPSPEAIAALREAADGVHRYPKAVHTELTEAIAAHWEVAPTRVWLASGSDGVLDYLARAFIEPGDGVLVPDPGFAYYPMSARFHHGRVRTYPVEKDRDFALDDETVLEAYDDERIVYLTSPHNPTGSRFDLEDVEAIAAGTREETLVVVDEAYAEFADAPSAIDRLDGRDDLAVLRTFSKAYGLAGCRLGYAVVPGEWADAYARVNTPFAVNAPGCRAGIAALGDATHVAETVELARWSRGYLREHLAVPTWESHANFVLAEVGEATAVTEALLDHGVIVRDCTSFGLPDCIRITCGTREQTERAVEACNRVVEAVR